MGEDFDAFYDRVYQGVQHRNVIVGALTSPRILFPLLILLTIILCLGYLLFTPYAWLNLILIPIFLLILGHFQYHLLPFGLLNEQMYDKYFMSEGKLSALNSKPQIVINSTNLETGNLFIFSKGYMGDASYNFDKARKETGLVFDAKEFPVSRAVAASSCVPFAFSPILIDEDYYIHASEPDLFHPVLVDGGVYDNQGGHRLTHPNSKHKCHYVLVSDAGNKLPLENTYSNVVALVLRSMNVFMNRIKSFQIAQYLYNKNQRPDLKVAYQSLGWDIEESIPEFVDSILGGHVSEELLQAHEILHEWIKQKDKEKISAHLETRIDYEAIMNGRGAHYNIELARSVGTNLTPLSKAKIDALIAHASAMTEIQIKLYHPWMID